MQDSTPKTADENPEMRGALEAADPATLLLALVQLTGEKHWLEVAKPFIRGPMNYQEFMPEELRAQVTSPGGTTAAGLRMLEGRAVRAAFLEAVAAATERSRQLGR